MSGVDIKALIERLRSRHAFVNDPISLKPRLLNPDGPEAADALEALQAENMEQARLLGMSAERELAAQARIAELGAELAAARKALEFIAHTEFPSMPPEVVAIVRRDHAREALAGGPTA
jgi:hypothetical protein